MRGLLVATCVVVGALLVPVASVLVWADRDLVDRDEFAALVVEGLQDPVAADAVASETVRRLRRQAAFGALSEERVQRLISRQLQDPDSGQLLEAIAYQAYPLVVRSRRAPLVADLSELYPAFLRTFPQLAAIAPDAPPELQRVRLVRTGDLPALSIDPDTLDWLTPVLAALAALLLAAGVAGARSRGLALLCAGLLVTAGAVAVLFVLEPLRDAIVDGVVGTAARIVTEEALERLGSGLEQQSWILAVAGLVVAGLGTILAALRR